MRRPFHIAIYSCLTPCRLSEGDRCDPYVSVYEPPEPSYAGDLTTMRWTGFIASAALEKILETVMYVA